MLKNNEKSSSAKTRLIKLQIKVKCFITFVQISNNKNGNNKKSRILKKRSNKKKQTKIQRRIISNVILLYLMLRETNGKKHLMTLLK